MLSRPRRDVTSSTHLTALRRVLESVHLTDSLLLDALGLRGHEIQAPVIQGDGHDGVNAQRQGGVGVLYKN